MYTYNNEREEPILPNSGSLWHVNKTVAFLNASGNLRGIDTCLNVCGTITVRPPARHGVTGKSLFDQ